MSYRNEFYLDGNRLFVTKSDGSSAYFALAEAEGQRFAFASATKGKVAPEMIELRIYDEATKKEILPIVAPAAMAESENMADKGLRGA